MKTMEFKTMINAPAEKVWEVLLGVDTYPIWTAGFAEGSKVKTDWKKGSKAIFLDGSGNGMVSEIAENIPNKFLSVRHLGNVINGVEDLDSEEVKGWAGALENYTLTEVDGQTEWSISADITEDFEGYMLKTWPLALAKVKELAESKG
ncbi:SRPBCC domain-containing protein [Pedobacter sp. PLR]|uniref:SRPBCC domain-containing protein n=1 Tax=Pedobacter sp. PLR TaxID=2994465 RepID=UPI002245C2C7|nr:SRPBCC domain-containing protein [Pedobacter sp. PLR]MCX2451441.1 SRPBCC domain-containing protein [Pedobacter sp. PLR]